MSGNLWPKIGTGIVVAVLAVYVVVGCASEAHYLVAGRDGYANVTSTREVRRSGRGSLFTRRHYQEVQFAFTEPNNTKRTGTSRESTRWHSPGRVAIRYTPGKDGRARIAGGVDWPAVGLGAVGLSVGAFFLARFAARGGFRSAG